MRPLTTADDNDGTLIGRPHRKMALLNQIQANLNSERGAAMVEYAFLVILIAIVAFVAVGIAGREVSTAFSTVADGLTNPN